MKWLNPDKTEIDLSGMTCHMQIRSMVNGVLLLNRTMESGITITDNLIHVTATPEDTSSISYPTGVYDLFITDSNGSTTKLIYGDVFIVENVTDV